jgi:MoaA/NifB/PqqE/SkfB family radical SAM enzyme
MNDIYCSAPWRSLAIMPNGEVRTCCVGSQALGNLNESSIQDIVNGPVLEKIQQELQTGTGDNCRICNNDEKQGNYASMRQYYRKHYPIYQSPTKHLEALDVRWNNKCNLACQYCASHSSSIWEEKLQIKTAKARKSYEDDLLEWVLPQLSGLREILLQGGEPMLMKQNYRLFALAPETCRFSIITNLSYDIENLPCMTDLLARPREQVIWNISAENTKSKFEYIRQGADWQQFRDNLIWLVKRWPTTIGMNMVYFLLSGYDILDTVKTFYSLGVKKFNLLSLHSNPCLMINSMPEDVQKRALDQLYLVKQWHSDEFGPDQDLYPIQGIDNIISGLHNAGSRAIIDKKTFFDKIAWHDSWATQKFSDLWPDLNQQLLDNLT